MKRLLITSLALNILMITGFGVKRYYYSRKPATPSMTEWSIALDKVKNDLYNAVPINSSDIVFVGDSHIERFLLNDYFPDAKIRNRGIGSNTTMQVIDRLPAILQRKPSKLFVLVGINDMSFGYSPDSVYNNIVRITSMVDRSNTSTHIISLFPTRGHDGNLNDAVRYVNNKLSEYCISNNITFINAYPELVTGGELNKDLTGDDCHLNGKGYSILKKVVEPYIN